MPDRKTDPTQSETAVFTCLDSNGTVTVTELLRFSRLSENELEELIGYGALTAVQQETQERVFSAALVGPLRTAAQLKLDYDLDIFGVALVLDYLQRIDQLQEQLRSMEARYGPVA